MSPSSKRTAAALRVATMADKHLPLKMHEGYHYFASDREDIDEDENPYEDTYDEYSDNKESASEGPNTESNTRDPDDLFEAAMECIQKIPDSRHGKTYDNFMTQTMVDFIFGSNQIEKAGLGYDATLNLCQAIFTAQSTRYFPSTPELETARREVVQHAYALQYILKHTIELSEPLTEGLICRTHQILTCGIPSYDGDTSYSGKYRDTDVTAGFSSFAPVAVISSRMAGLIVEYNADIRQSVADNALDPFYLAAKFCHKLVNIHPFLDGNGRMCRLLLNAVLMKHIGIMIVIGNAGENDVEQYLCIASRGSMSEQMDDDGDDNEEGTCLKAPWAELATLVLRKGVDKLEELESAL